MNRKMANSTRLTDSPGSRAPSVSAFIVLRLQGCTTEPEFCVSVEELKSIPDA